MADNNITDLYLGAARLCVGSDIADDIAILPLTSSLPDGPHLCTNHLGPDDVSCLDTYRLMEDTYEAFIYGTLLTGGDWMETHMTLQSTQGDTSASFIPIPSRIPSFSSGLPLAGLRFALKDIFDVEGLHTYAGSIPYGMTRPLPSHTAPSVQRLLDLGATLVGKTKTSQFAHGANPWDFIDFGYPWNPRGDGFLTASSSSSGSACAIAAYGWIDFAVGSDTRGSVRKPAALVGALGIRPSHGAITLEGVVPLAEEMDTAGILSRDVEIFHKVAMLWYPEVSTPFDLISTTFPTSLIYPTDHFPVTYPSAQRVIDEFIMRASAQFGMTVVPTDMTASLIPIFPNSNFTQFQVLSNILAEYYSYTEVALPLVRAYQAIHGVDSLPPLDTIPQRIFARAKHFTAEDYATAVQSQREFTAAVSTHVLRPDPISCSESIMVYDIGFGGVPSYRLQSLNQLEGARDLPLNSPWEMSNIADGLNYLAAAGGLPEVTVPIGQVPYLSHVTSRMEVLPVAIQLVAHRGCDAMLLNFVAALKGRGVIGSIQVGNMTFAE
ncbi:hypothetical protein HGRIS_010276 [Hohenbuehelia grisea]